MLCPLVDIGYFNVEQLMKWLQRGKKICEIAMQILSCIIPEQSQRSQKSTQFSQRKVILYIYI